MCKTIFVNAIIFAKKFREYLDICENIHFPDNVLTLLSRHGRPVLSVFPRVTCHADLSSPNCHGCPVLKGLSWLPATVVLSRLPRPSCSVSVVIF
jgi:hypothetical protein